MPNLRPLGCFLLVYFGVVLVVVVLLVLVVVVVVLIVIVFVAATDRSIDLYLKVMRILRISSV